MSKKIDIPKPLEPLALILLFVVGLLLMLSFELRTLKCNRLQLNQKVACEVTNFSLRGKHITVIPAGKIQFAETRRGGTRGGRRGKRIKLYKVVILTGNERIPITVFSGLLEYLAYQKAYQINNFLNNPEQMSLTVQQHPNWRGVLAVIIFIFGLDY